MIVIHDHNVVTSDYFLSDLFVQLFSLAS